MNKSLPRVDMLKAAMEAADVDTLERIAETIGRDAVAVAMVEVAEVKVEASVEAQRQRDLDAAFADAIEVVNRARQRQGRRVCSTHDGKTTRQVFELLRSVMGPEAGADQDPSFQ